MPLLWLPVNVALYLNKSNLREEVSTNRRWGNRLTSGVMVVGLNIPSVLTNLKSIVVRVRERGVVFSSSHDGR